MDEPLIPPHGGYQGLRAFKMAVTVHDGTVAFCRAYVDRRSRTVEQMVQAARSGKLKIAEGSVASGTSKKIELKLIGIARASQEELLVDYQDYLRQNGFDQWLKDREQTAFIKQHCYRVDRSYMTYKTYIEDKGTENAANLMTCIVHQTC